jgi:MFS family permease
MQASLLRAFTFTFFVSAMWSLLAVVARRDLRQGPLGYGILNGSLGVGAVLAATILGRIRRRFPADRIIAASTLYYAVTLLVLAFVRSPAIIIATLLVAGFCWTSTMATLNTSVQMAVPAWVQARALGTYLMTFQGGLALGSVVWGFIAEHSSTPTALSCSAAGLLLTLPFVHRFKILHGPLPDHTPYQWKRPAPQLADDSDATAGPVRVSIEYRIPVDRYAAFTHAIHELRKVRLRDGAIRWGIYRDAIHPEHLNETFVMESWLDYLRSRERVTAADAAIRDRVYALHQDTDPPRISHQIYAHEVTE